MPASADQLMASGAVPFECPHCVVLSQHNRVTWIPGPKEAVTLPVIEESTDPPTPTGSWAYTVNLTHHIVRCTNCGKDTYFTIRSKAGSISGTLPPPGPPKVDAVFRSLAPHEIVHQHAIYFSHASCRSSFGQISECRS